MLVRSNLPTCFPLVVEGNNELCFLTNTQSKKALGCNIFGHLFCADKPNGWEVWRIIPLDNGSHVLLISWTHDQKVLCSNELGHVYTTENRHGTWERWSIEKHSDGGVWIRSVHHKRLLSVQGNDLVTTDTSGDTDSCYWDLQAANHFTGFFLSTKASPSEYISCRKHGAVGTSHNRKAWEVWQVHFVEPGYVVFQSKAHHHRHNGQHQYLMCKGPQEGGEIFAAHSSKQNATRWLVHDSPCGGLCFCAHGTSLYLSSYHGHVATVDISRAPSLEETETFHLLPNMPGTSNNTCHGRINCTIQDEAESMQRHFAGWKYWPLAGST